MQYIDASPLLMLLAIWAFDAIVDLGSGTYQVGTLRRVGSGNPIEAILNSQSKRFSPTVVGYDGEQFHVGEYGAAFAKKNPGPVFRYFSADPVSNLTKYANDPDAPELEDVVYYYSVLLITALMNHIVTHMIKRTDTQIDITLIHPPRLTLSYLSAFKTAIEYLPNTTLFLTVPTPAAVVITHLASRMKDFDKEKRGQQFIVIDIGASTTEASVVQAIFSKENNDVEVHLMYNVHYPKGGEHLNDCIARKFVVPKLPNYDPKNLKLKKLISDGVEKAKISLSGLDVTQLVVESASSEDDFKMELTRAQLEECAAEIWNDETLAEFMNIAFYIDQDFGDDTFYLFYGGSSRIPYVQYYFENFFGAPILKTVNLDEGAIYGGGLVTARHIVGFKVANRFNSFDETRPFLYYNSDRNTTEKLYRLNAHVKHGFTSEFPLYTENTFSLGNGSFNVNHINESFYWETEESGERKKKSSQMYNTDSVEYTKIISDPDPFTQLHFTTYVDDEARNENYFDYVCNLTIAKFDHKTILKKYEPKKKDNNGMSGIKVYKMPEIRRDAEKYSQSVKDFYNLVVSHLNNATVREQYDIKLAVNFTTDSASMPNVTYVAMHVIDKAKLASALESEAKGRKVDPSTYTQEFALEPKCEFKHNPKYMVDDYIFREAFNVVWDSNDIQAKRKQYEDSFNMIEDILINADDFLKRYPASDSDEGNFLVYKSESDFLKVAIDDARYFMQHNSYLPHCPCVECLEERLHDLSAVLTRVIELQQNISKHIEIQQCRPAVEEKFNKAVADMEDAIAKVNEFQTSDKAAKFNQTMEQCAIIKSLGIDTDDDKPKDDDKKKKKEAKKAKLPYNIYEKEWFKGLFQMHAEHSNGTITEEDIADLENFYSRGMMKKLRKSNNDCGFLNGSYSKMVKKLENLTNEKDGKRKDFIEFQEKFQAEMSMRPETECDRIKNRSKDVEKEVEDLTKSIKDTRSEIDRARLLNVIPQLYEQAREYKRLSAAIDRLKQLIKESKLGEAAEVFAQEMKVAVTEPQVYQLLKSQHWDKIEKADINTYDKIMDDIKDFFRFEAYNNKEEL